MNARRTFLKRLVGTAATFLVGVPATKATICDKLLGVQQFKGPRGLGFLLQRQFESNDFALEVHKKPMELAAVNIEQHDRQTFADILRFCYKLDLPTGDNNYQSFARAWQRGSNYICIRSRRGGAQVTVVHPDNKKLVEYCRQIVLDIHPSWNICTHTHPDVPYNSMLQAYKGSQFYDALGIMAQWNGKTATWIDPQTISNYATLTNFTQISNV